MRRLRAGDAIVLTQAGRPAMELAKNAEKTNIAPKIAKLMNAVGSEVAIAEGMAAIDLKRHCNWVLHIAKVGYFFSPSLPNME